MSAVKHPLSLMLSWHVQGQLYMLQRTRAIWMIIFSTYILTAGLKAVKKQLRGTTYQANSEHGESK